MYIYIYIYIYIYNIISSTAGLFLKYKNQMLRNSIPNPDIACCGDTISTSRHLKKLLPA